MTKKTKNKLILIELSLDEEIYNIVIEDERLELGLSVTGAWSGLADL